MGWLWPAVGSVEQIVEVIMVERYTSILPLKPQAWVLCHKPSTFKEAIVLMEALYALAEAVVTPFCKLCLI